MPVYRLLSVAEYFKGRAITLTMNILVFSDSHNYYNRMAKIVKSHIDSINYIIHLGDLVHDAKKLKADFESPAVKVEYVYGNCDFSPNRNDYEKELVICEKRFFILHGHTRSIQISSAPLKNLAEQKKYDIILYGHTHIPKEDYHNGTFIINPGSIELPRDGGNPSYAMINISDKDGKIQTDIRRCNL